MCVCCRPNLNFATTASARVELPIALAPLVSAASWTRICQWLPWQLAAAAAAAGQPSERERRGKRRNLFAAWPSGWRPPFALRLSSLRNRIHTKQTKLWPRLPEGSIDELLTATPCVHRDARASRARSFRLSGLRCHSCGARTHTHTVGAANSNCGDQQNSRPALGGGGGDGSKRCRAPTKRLAIGR